MIKLYGKSIVCLLKLVFEAYLQSGEFPDYWGKKLMQYLSSKKKEKSGNKPFSDF